MHPRRPAGPFDRSEANRTLVLNAEVSRAAVGRFDLDPQLRHEPTSEPCSPPNGSTDLAFQPGIAQSDEIVLRP